MVENSVPDTADAAAEVGKIGQAANLSDLEDAIADIAKHQEDMLEENALERVVPIVDYVPHQKNIPGRVDTTTAEANVTDLEEIVDVVKHQEEEDMVEESILERVLPIVDDGVHHQKNVPVRADTTAEEIVR